jgi:hypothetical protein
MALGAFLTNGLGNGTFQGNIPQFVLTGLISSEAAVVIPGTPEDGATWYVVLKSAKGVR